MHRGTVKAVAEAWMFLDVDLQSRELVVCFHSWQQNWETGYTSCLRFTGKLSCIKMPSQRWPRKFVTFESHKIAEETYLAYTSADNSFRHLDRHVWCLPALAITLVKIIRLSPPKFRWGSPPQSVANCGLLPLPLDIFQFKMCQNNHLVITDLCAKFYVNQWWIWLRMRQCPLKY